MLKCFFIAEFLIKINSNVTSSSSSSSSSKKKKNYHSFKLIVIFFIFKKKKRGLVRQWKKKSIRMMIIGNGLIWFNRFFLFLIFIFLCLINNASIRQN
jgi:hypothetical protein